MHHANNCPERSFKSAKSARPREMKAFNNDEDWNLRESTKVNVKRRVQFQLEKGLIGLVNMNNTCYMNAVLQVLGHLDSFTQIIMRLNIQQSPSTSQTQVMRYSQSGRPIRRLAGSSANSDSANETNCAQKWSICKALHIVFNAMWSGKANVFSPRALKDAIHANIKGFSNNEQHDAHEFLVMLLSAINEEMKHFGSRKSAVETIFEGTMIYDTDCEECPFAESSRRSETFQELRACFLPEIVNKGKSKLQNKTERIPLLCMLRHSSTWEEYSCKRCNISCRRNRTYVRKYPNILRIFINRFVWIRNCEQLDQSETGLCKINWHVEFPITLELPEQPTGLDKETRVIALFALRAVINHDGWHCDRGHYHCLFYFKNKDCWVRANDKQLERVDVSEVQDSNAYMLFYERVGSRGMDELGST